MNHWLHPRSIAPFFAAIVIAASVDGVAAQAIAPAGSQAAAPNLAHAVAPGAAPTMASPRPQQGEAATEPQRTTLSLDNDLITFTKTAAWIGGIFIAIFATIAVGFFGFDVRAVRKSLHEASDELRTRMESIRKDHQVLVELKGKLEKLGGELVGLIDEKSPAPAPSPVPVPAPPEQPADSITEPADADSPYTTPNGRRLTWREVGYLRSQIRQTIENSDFEWSTLGSIANRTRMAEEIVKMIADNDPMILAGIGRNGGSIYKLHASPASKT